MKKLTLGLIIVTGASALAATDFDTDLVRSGYVHSLLPLDRENSLEATYAKKKVLADSVIDLSSGWKHEGIGKLTVKGNEAVLEYPNSTGKRARGNAGDQDYALYGHSVAKLDMRGANLEPWNRISFDITPDCEGMRVVNLNLYLANYAHPKDGYNQPTGYHLINLENGKTNHCTLEIADLQRDKVAELVFSASLNGKDQTTGDTARYTISNMKMEQIERPNTVSGWRPDDGIVYSMTGYDTNGKKTAIVNAETAGSASQFSLIDPATSTIVYSAPVRMTDSSVGKFGVIDFSDFKTPGTYLLAVGDHKTKPFPIGDNSIWDNSEWKVLNYIFGQRCGYAVPGIHGQCHTDMFAVHDDVMIPYSGGWHDAGDLSQQTLQTGDVAFALLEASQKCKERNPALSARLREEALWGLDFAMRCRFGDGYRASSMGLLHWTDGKQNDFDDIKTVRTQNLAYDNFMFAGYEAYAAMVLKDFDPEYADYCKRVAIEDYNFAVDHFAKNGLGNWRSMMEHSYNTSMSQFMANISWASSQLYALTGEQKYADKAREAMNYVLECQQTTPVSKKVPVSGFFYRDKDRKSLVHYIHQSREQSYMQALEAICRTQPDSPELPKWKNAVRLYGNYIKGLMKHTAPYGMIPSGIYRDDEYNDSTGFYSLHIFAPENAPELYKEQLNGGVKLDKKWYVKRFPVWFNIFNGNTAVHLSMGKSAAIAGNMLDDPELLDIAREQLYWTVGKNPFAQSLIYGEGHDYPMMNSFSSGEITGEMPVGIRTIGNTDNPYWPQINNACYKEVWVTSAGKWISLISEF